jgi:hypothetical protein
MDASYTTSEAPVNEIEAEKYRNVTIDVDRKGGNCVTRHTVTFWAFFPTFLVAGCIGGLVYYAMLRSLNAVGFGVGILFFGLCNWGIVRGLPFIERISTSVGEGSGSITLTGRGACGYHCEIIDLSRLQPRLEVWTGESGEVTDINLVKHNGDKKPLMPTWDVLNLKQIKDTLVTCLYLYFKRPIDVKYLKGRTNQRHNANHHHHGHNYHQSHAVCTHNCPGCAHCCPANYPAPNNLQQPYNPQSPYYPAGPQAAYGNIPTTAYYNPNPTSPLLSTIPNPNGPQLTTTIVGGPQISRV